MNSYKGLLSLVLVTVIYGFYGVFSRMIGIDFGVFTQSGFRNFIILLVSLVFVLYMRLWKLPEKKDWLWILLWVGGDLAATIGIFIAFNKISIGTSYLLFYTGSIIVGLIIGKVIFQEKINSTKILSFILLIIGLYIIYSSDFSFDKNFYMILAFISGACVAVYNTFSKKFSHKYHRLELVFLDGLVAFGFSLILGYLFKERLPLFTLSLSWLGIILFAVSNIFTIQLIVYGFKKTEAQIGSLIMPLEVVFGALTGYVFIGKSYLFQRFSAEY